MWQLREGEETEKGDLIHGGIKDEEVWSSKASPPPPFFTLSLLSGFISHGSIIDQIRSRHHSLRWEYSASAGFRPCSHVSSRYLSWQHLLVTKEKVSRACVKIQQQLKFFTIFGKHNLPAIIIWFYVLLFSPFTYFFITKKCANTSFDIRDFLFNFTLVLFFILIYINFACVPVRTFIYRNVSL